MNERMNKVRDDNIEQPKPEEVNKNHARAKCRGQQLYGTEEFSIIAPGYTDKM